MQANKNIFSKDSEFVDAGTSKGLDAITAISAMKSRKSPGYYTSRIKK